MLDPNLTVEKSKKLIWSKYSKWSAGELAVFDTYLSRINARDPESAEVVFTKREYEELLGLSKIRPEQLSKYIRNFVSNSVEIKTDRGWRYYALFDRAVFEKNQDTGEWQITLRCHPDLQDAFFALSEAGYQAYRLKYTLDMKSKYSKVLYGMLKDQEWRGEWKVELRELRDLIGAVEPSWEAFKEFNRRILKVAQEEINTYTDIEFEYEKVTKGRLTKAIIFKIKKKQTSEEDIIDGQMGIDDFIDEPAAATEQEEITDPHVKLLMFLSEACNNEFTLSQMEELLDLAKDHAEPSIFIEEYHRNLFDYLQRKYRALQNKKGVNSRFGYMKFLVSANK